MTRVETEMMNNKTVTTQKLVILPHREQLVVNNIANIALHEGLCLDDVMGVEKFQCNLLSVSPFTKDTGCLLIFSLTFVLYKTDT